MRVAALLIVLSCHALAAARVAGRLARDEPERLTAVERATWVATASLALWIAQGTVLSLAGRFEPLALVATALATAAGAWWLTRDRTPEDARAARAPLGTPARRPLHGWSVLALGFVAACVAYSAAALWVLPVSNHDALAYHFPKAARLATTGAFGLYPSQDLRVTYFPGNYEMLAATCLVFLHSDRATGFITTGALALFLASAAALFARTWRRGPAPALTLPLVFASPVLFLHVTAHKNDILMAGLTLTGLLWLGRWASGTAGGGAAWIGVTAVALAAGTKFHGLFVALACAVPLAVAWRRGVWRPDARAASLQAMAAAGLALLLGGFQYVANVAATGSPTGVLQIATPNAMNTVAYPAFGQVPRAVLMLLGAPFFTSGQYFTVPFTGEDWFWPAYELYFSHYGAHVTLCVLLLPAGVWWTRRHAPAAAVRELTVISAAALVLVGLNLLMGLRPYGGFAFIPRFLFFALPVVLAWTWCALADGLSRRRLAWVPAVLGLAIAGTYVTVAAAEDRFSPVSYVELLWRAPEWRREVFQTNWRAATFVDRVAPAGAVVAIDAGYDGWTYPLYGERLSRTVHIIVDERAAYDPPAAVEWVAVDRAFSKVWGHPAFVDMTQARRYIDRGPLPDHEALVYRRLLHHPDFRLVYSYPQRYQAVFQRIRPHPAPASLERGGVSGAPW